MDWLQDRVELVLANLHVKRMTRVRVHQAMRFVRNWLWFK